MKNLSLNHSQTPSQLVETNNKLEALLDSGEFEESILLQLVGERDNLINQHLTRLDHEQKAQFAEKELEINKQLVVHVSKLQRTVLAKLSGLLKGKKAVKKYK